VKPAAGSKEHDGCLDSLGWAQAAASGFKYSASRREGEEGISAKKAFFPVFFFFLFFFIASFAVEGNSRSRK